jgi:hypothetical protein
MDREIHLIRNLLDSLVKRRETNEISSASYNICLYLLRELTREINSQSRVSRKSHPDVDSRQLNIELARAGSRFSIFQKGECR